MYALKSATLILGVAVLAAPASAQYPLIPGVEGVAMMYAFEPFGQSYLGVDPEDISPERAAALKVKVDNGVEIRQVDQDSPAGKAGLKKYDVILEFNGTHVNSAEQLRRMIHETPAGRTVTLNISRNGEPLNFSTQLVDYRVWAPQVSRTASSSPNRSGFINNEVNSEDMQELNLPEASSSDYTSRAGMIVENLSPQLAEYFGVQDGKGALVRSIEKGSAADLSGVKAGDVVRKIENRRIANRWDFRQTMDAHKSGKLNILVWRDKHPQTVTVTIDPNQSEFEWLFPATDNLEAALRP